jgi:hypothetical protein
MFLLLKTTIPAAKVAIKIRTEEERERENLRKNK